MPYIMKKNAEGKVCVFNKTTGENKGCSDTKKEATAHMRALYAAEGGAKMGEKELDELVTKAIEESDEEYLKMYDEPWVEVYIPWKVTSFSELDAYRESREAAAEIRSTTDDFMRLINNVMDNPEIENKVASIKALADEYGSRIESDIDSKEATMKSEGDGKHPASHYLVVEDPKKPTTWHLRVKNMSGGLDRGLMGAAYAALTSNYRGNPYKGPNKSGALSKLKGLYKSKGWSLPGSEKKDSLTEKAMAFLTELANSVLGKNDESDMVTKEVNIFKDADGSYRWIGRYSNNIRDDDNPKEIISSNSHKRFVERVDKGLAALPELWIWHGEPTKIGLADLIAYDESGFAIAGGTFDERLSHEVIEEIKALPEMAMSHGMPKYTIKRDENDPTIIVEHESKEISLLPRWAAANKRTDWIILEDKEDNMFSQKDKEKLMNWGISEEAITQIEEMNQSDADKAAQEGVESKEVDELEDAATETEVAQESIAETADETPAETEAEPQDTEEEEKETSDIDVVAAIRDELKPLVERVSSLEESVKSLNESQELISKALGDTPAASLPAVLASIQSAIGSEESKVDGRTSLAKSKPKEAEAGNDAGRTLIPFVNKLISE